MPTVRKVTSSLSLPTTLNAPPENLEDYCCMIYGRKQWGKSTLSAQYPDSINAQFEPGRRGLRILQVAPQSIAEAHDYIQLFLEHDDLMRITVDTVDRFYEMHLVAKCLELSNGNRTHPGQFGNEGYAIWDIVKNEFEKVFEGILAAGKTFTVVSHDKKVKQKDRDGMEWERVEPTCKPAAWKIAQSMCDFVFHVDFLNGDRIITVRDLDNSTLASCNPEIDCFLDPDGKPLRRFKVPNTQSKAFETLNDAFHNKLRDYDYSPPVRPLAKKPLGKKTAVTK